MSLFGILGHVAGPDILEPEELSLWHKNVVKIKYNNIK
jgi:hypothetical protein